MEGLISLGSMSSGKTYRQLLDKISVYFPPVFIVYLVFLMFFIEFVYHLGKQVGYFTLEILLNGKAYSNFLDIEFSLEYLGVLIVFWLIFLYYLRIRILPEYKSAVSELLINGIKTLQETDRDEYPNIGIDDILNSLVSGSLDIWIMKKIWEARGNLPRDTPPYLRNLVRSLLYFFFVVIWGEIVLLGSLNIMGKYSSPLILSSLLIKNQILFYIAYSVILVFLAVLIIWLTDLSNKPIGVSARGKLLFLFLIPLFSTKFFSFQVSSYSLGPMDEISTKRLLEILNPLLEYEPNLFLETKKRRLGDFLEKLEWILSNLLVMRVKIGNEIHFLIGIPHIEVVSYIYSPYRRPLRRYRWSMMFIGTPDSIMYLKTQILKQILFVK